MNKHKLVQEYKSKSVHKRIEQKYKRTRVNDNKSTRLQEYKNLIMQDLLRTKY